MMALLRGADLSPWHDLPAWRAEAGLGWKDVNASLTGLDWAVARMAQMAFGTAARANGQEVTRITKVKNVQGFPDRQALQA